MDPLLCPHVITVVFIAWSLTKVCQLSRILCYCLCSAIVNQTYVGLLYWWFAFPVETDYPPKADAGSDVVINLPQNSVVLCGNASTDDKGIAAYEWFKSTDSLTGDMTVSYLLQVKTAVCQRECVHTFVEVEATATVIIAVVKVCFWVQFFTLKSWHYGAEVSQNMVCIIWWVSDYVIFVTRLL